MLNARKPARRFAVVASLSAGVLLSSAVTATADEPPSGGAEQCFPNVICTDANSGGKTPGGGSTKPGGGGGGGSESGPQLCSYHGVPWACYDPQWGWFDSGVGCYFRQLDNPPAAGDPAWEGHDPKDGALYSKVCPQTGGGQDGAQVVFLANPPNGAATMLDDARAVEQAKEMLVFGKPVARVAPGGTAVVNSPVWLWAENAATPGPKTAAVHGISVTVTPKLVEADWSFGNGLSTTCATAGTPYDPAYGAAASPDCGFVFKAASGTQKDGAYAATVTMKWQVTAVVVGGPNPRTFTIPMSQTSAVFALRVAEVQVLN
ncbi:hypothetical protein ACIRD3_02505 [Kitasatospora sp. NPDC093550]|uniref:hypothetical protein n=1 Tax=Kitasatospora sp. NPDC093550 TaxID=3364089 RepID=UPI003818B58C